MITQFTNKFTLENSAQVFLSPYTGINYTNSGIFIYHTVNLQKFFIPGNPDKLKKIFSSLKSGIDFPVLVSMVNQLVSESDAENWIADCFQKGILE